MPPQSPDPRQLGRYVALAQVGLEMAAPIGLGLWIDYLLGWSPWGVVVGAILGLAGGIVHLTALANRPDNQDHEPKP